MAYRDAIAYIERMNPDQCKVAADEFGRVMRLLGSATGPLHDLRGKVEWEGAAADLYERRLAEADTIVEDLQNAYDKAHRALDDYVTAQHTAKGHVARGIHAEQQLGSLISSIAGTQSGAVQRADPLRQWSDLRSNTGFLDWLGELGQGDAIEAVRAEADRLWHEARSAYDDALRVETGAREPTVRGLKAALAQVPDFQADRSHAETIIGATPGLRDEVLQAARDPNARRPTAGILGMYQVAEDPNSRMYPDGVNEVLGEIATGGDLTQRRLRASEAAILDELSPLEMNTFANLEREAFAAANARFASPDQNDDQNDAFRHAYWNARLTQEFGEDWATRFTTAHESGPGNPAAREAMDLYNNEVGRAVGAANPNASPEEIADLIAQRVNTGDTVVIGPDGTLEYSDQIRPEDTGLPAPVTLPGHPQPPKPPEES